MERRNFIRNISWMPLSVAIGLALALVQCTKPKVHYLQPTAQSTFESRETFTCRINGRPFIRKAVDAVSLGTCTYKPEYSGEEGYVFEITANQHEASCLFYSITIKLDSVEIRNGRSYTLGTPGRRKHSASYFYINACGNNGKTLYTSDDLQSELFIIRIDTVKKVVQGTFDLKIRDSAGVTYRMSDGFFDQYYR